MISIRIFVYLALASFMTCAFATERDCLRVARNDYHNEIRNVCRDGILQTTRASKKYCKYNAKADYFGEQAQCYRQYTPSPTPSPTSSPTPSPPPFEPVLSFDAATTFFVENYNDLSRREKQDLEDSTIQGISKTLNVSYPADDRSGITNVDVIQSGRRLQTSNSTLSYQYEVYKTLPPNANATAEYEGLSNTLIESTSANCTTNCLTQNIEDSAQEQGTTLPTFQVAPVTEDQIGAPSVTTASPTPFPTSAPTLAPTLAPTPTPQTIAPTVAPTTNTTTSFRSLQIDPKTIDPDLRRYLKNNGVITEDSDEKQLARQVDEDSDEKQLARQVDVLDDNIAESESLRGTRNQETTDFYTYMKKETRTYNFKENTLKLERREKKVALVLPFHRTEFRKVSHWLRDLTKQKICSNEFKSRKSNVDIYLIFAYNLNFSEAEGELIQETLVNLLSEYQESLDCFDAVQIINLDQNRALGHLDGACTTFYKLTNVLSDFNAMQLAETDVRPVKTYWLESWANYVESVVEGACSNWWVKGSPSMCNTDYGKIDERLDFHINGNSLYALGCSPFEEYLGYVQDYYPPTIDSPNTPGCDTGKEYEGGYDHTMFQYRRQPENFAYSRSIMNKFQYSYEVINFCEDRYNPESIRKLFPETIFVHSKSVFLSSKTKSIYEIYEKEFSTEPTITELQKMLPLIHQGYESKDLVPLQNTVPEKEAKKKVHLWSTDLHVGPIGCNLPIFSKAGAIVHAQIDFNNCNIAGLCKKDLQVLDFDDWRGFSLESGGRTPSQLIDEFYAYYKDDPEMKDIDAFICSHPVANCQLYMPFKKPIIIYATTRLEFGRHDGLVFWREQYWNEEKGKKEWEKWLRDLLILSKSPKNVIAANNHYDANYIKYFTGIDALVIPSWCSNDFDDIRKVNAGKTPYQVDPGYFPYIPTVLIGPYRTNLDLARNGSIIGTVEDHPIVSELYDSYSRIVKNQDSTKFNIEFSENKKAEDFSVTDFGNYRAIICIPYQVSTINIVEIYRQNIPMFFPSLKFLTELKNKHGIMWERIYGLPERIPGLFSESPLADMPYPNANDDVSFQFWVKYSDWYTMPHIQLFDSFDHLMYLLTKANFYEISKNMKQYNSLEEERLVQQWKDIFSKF